ncbi:MAG: FAD-dependent oxidoreductase [Spongiibacteraceae bacterium]
MNDTSLTLLASKVTHYTHTSDVLVVGFGIAGACAALEARRAGADVMLIERSSAGGGASALSSGLFYLGGWYRRTESLWYRG